MNAVVMPLDHTLEIEALGSSIYWENGKPFIKEHFSLEEVPSAKRFAQVEGKNIPLFAVVTGPLTIWSMLYSQPLDEMTNDKLSELPHLDKIVQSVIAMCRGYANAGVDGIIVNEANMNLQIEDIQSLTGIYKPIFNVISYFNLLSVLLNPQQSEKNSTVIFRGRCECRYSSL